MITGRNMIQCPQGGYSDLYLLHRLTLFFGGQKFEFYLFFFCGVLIIHTIFGVMSICVAIFGHVRFGRYF